MKPEQEVRNYYVALTLLEKKVKEDTDFSKDLIMEVQAMVEKGVSKDKIGLRGAVPPGVLFVVYDSETGRPDYIPPEYIDIPGLLDELVEYVNTTDDHPLIVATIVYYQLVTIHPFEDDNVIIGTSQLTQAKSRVALICPNFCPRRGMRRDGDGKFHIYKPKSAGSVLRYKIRLGRLRGKIRGLELCAVL